jgi:hypothetical protein
MRTPMITFLDLHLNAVLYGLLFLLAVVNFVAQRGLYINLKRYDPSQWTALGSPEPFKITKREFQGINSVRDQLQLSWYILSMRYRSGERSEIWLAGDILLGCYVGIWLIALYLIFSR